MVNILWMDGGILYELNKIDKDFGETAIVNNPDILKSLYVNYINLGAKFITTNNYAFKPSRQHNWKELCIRGASLFTGLKLDHPHITILGSIPPFHPTYKTGPISPEFIAFYKELVKILALYVDTFILETQIDYGHCDHICNIITKHRENAEIFLSIYPDKITVEELWRLVRKYPMIKAILINCCSFDKMRDYYDKVVSRVLAAHKSVAFGFYLNKIDEVAYSNKQLAGELQNYEIKHNEYNKINEFIDSLDLKQIMIGGCCGYGVTEMKQMIKIININQETQLK